MPHPAPVRARRRGFTLIELIVVVIIIAVLAAIAAVAYNQFAATARSNAVVASATDLRTAVMAAAARDDLAPAAEVDTLWTAASGDSVAFLEGLSASYDGPLTYTATADGNPATLQVGAANGGAHTACLTLPSTVSEPVTIRTGTCAAGSGGDTLPPLTGAGVVSRGAWNSSPWGSKGSVGDTGALRIWDAANTRPAIKLGKNFTVPVAGTYTVVASCDDSCTVSIDGVAAGTNYKWDYPDSWPVTLTSGKHQMIIDGGTIDGVQGLLVTLTAADGSHPVHTDLTWVSLPTS